ncbi:MAG: tRNA lysidine(34) synthetase TilS [Treponema sp.]|nr:tRNA lysidine(34) synthetase TilS [Treponema sp.]
MEAKLRDFERRILSGLQDCGINILQLQKTPDAVIGAAVSGGADSISLLYALSEITRCYKLPLKIITVNHFIRPDEESSADANYVIECCRSLKAEGYDVECQLVELGHGEVTRLTAERGGGIEEAARYLRYKAFEAFAEKYSLSILCLAHNKNDQLETLLMRFLQGSWLEAGVGIRGKRALYVRPMLGIERSEIEDYLKERGISWRIDSTNSDTAYLRNRIRQLLVPLLNQNFPSWKNGLLAGAEKASLDSQLIEAEVEKLSIDESQKEKGELSILLSDFDSLSDGIKFRSLLKMANMLGLECRLSYSFLKDFLLAYNNSSGKDFTKSFSTIEFSVKKDRLFVKKAKKIHTDLVFFAIIEEKGIYDFPFGSLTVGEQLSFNGQQTGFSPDFPFCLRNFCIGDEVLTADGKMKNLADVFADWKVSAEDRPLIPLITEVGKGDKIKALFASFLGYKDWIVK